jgi:CHAT domain-containing protein
LHAAGGNTHGLGTALADWYTISYTPTLTALLNARRNLRPISRKAARILLAAVPLPFKVEWPPLPSVLDEMDCVERTIQSVQNPLDPRGAMNTVTRLESATSSDVLCSLPDTSVLHLACHGHQDLQTPLASGFLMSDKMLTVTQLMELQLPNAFLAFLSACDTAKGDDRHLDQAIHLASTMLFAGFKSVIGTMWYDFHIFPTYFFLTINPAGQ